MQNKHVLWKEKRWTRKWKKNQQADKIKLDDRVDLKNTKQKENNKMVREHVFAYIKNEYDVEPDYPFAKDPETAVLRHRDTRKWFALVMPVRADKLGYDSENWIDVVTMKSEPMLIDSLITRQGFHRAFHMNKTQWLTIELGDKASDKEIRNLIDMSFDLTYNYSCGVCYDGGSCFQGFRYKVDQVLTKKKNSH